MAQTDTGFNAPGPGSNPQNVNPLSGLITVIQQMVKGQQQLITSLATLNTTLGTKFSPVFVAVPANSAAAGVYGQVAIDANFFYIYTGTAWRRVAVVAF